MHDRVHEFALYVPKLSSYKLQEGHVCTIEDKELKHRLITVLRLKNHDYVTFFDVSCVVQAKIVDRNVHSKKTFAINVLNYSFTKSLSPSLTVAVGLTKHDSLEKIVYYATQLGVTHLQLLSTEKSQHRNILVKEHKRLERIMISAAEQAKQFVLPKLYGPIPFKDYLENLANDDVFSIYYARGKKKIQYFLESVCLQNITSRICIFIGPEGGFSSYEMSLFEQNCIPGYQLVPTVLRACEAVLVGVALFRSLISDV